MKEINVQEYLRDNPRTEEMIILKGNVVQPNLRGFVLKAFERNRHRDDNAFKPTVYESLPSTICLIADEAATGLGADFEGITVAADIIGITIYDRPIIAVEHQDSETGILLETGDAILVSEKTTIDPETGLETYTVACLPFEAFYKSFKLFVPAKIFFQPSPNPEINPEGLRGASATAPCKEQLNAIRPLIRDDDYDNYPFCIHPHYRNYIYRLLAHRFNVTLASRYEEALRAGIAYNELDRVFDDTAVEIAGSKGYFDKSDYIVYRLELFTKFMNKPGFEETLRQNFGDDHVNRLAADWAGDLLSEAQTGNGYVSKAFNPAALAGKYWKYLRSVGSDNDFVRRAIALREYGGHNITLGNALRDKFEPACVDAFLRSPEVQRVSGIWWGIGDRLVKREVERYKEALGLTPPK